MEEYPESVRIPDDEELKKRGVEPYGRDHITTLSPEELEELIETGTVVKKIPGDKKNVVRVRE